MITTLLNVSTAVCAAIWVAYYVGLVGTKQGPTGPGSPGERRAVARNKGSTPVRREIAAWLERGRVFFETPGEGDRLMEHLAHLVVELESMDQAGDLLDFLRPEVPPARYPVLVRRVLALQMDEQRYHTVRHDSEGIPL